jgi:hypothetical protein
METISKKILWIHVKSALRQDISSRDIADPKIRLRAIERIEELLRRHFPKEYSDPIEFMKIDKDFLIKRLGQYKDKGQLAGSEKSIINNIYEYLSNHVEAAPVSNSSEKEIALNVREDIAQISMTVDSNPKVYEESMPIVRFEKEIQILKQLFSNEFVVSNLNRINDIFSTTEKLWEAQIQYLPKEGIKYLFIAEAPPWSSIGEIKYIYNPESEPRTLLKALSKAFFGEYIYQSIGVKETLKKLTESGLMVFDSLPFAWDYSNKRNNKYYSELLSLTINSYLIPKINRIDLTYNKYLKTAFGFKKNASIVIEKMEGNLLIDSLTKSFDLNANQISANDAGYPDAKRIKEIFGLV